MKPMTLREVAEAIEMHESTVSRVTSNKYLLCDRGLYELKYFFGSGVASAEAATAPRPRRSRPRSGELIDAETEILSDDAIAALLKQRGLRLSPAGPSSNIARRWASARRSSAGGMRKIRSGAGRLRR